MVLALLENFSSMLYIFCRLRRVQIQAKKSLLVLDADHGNSVVHLLDRKKQQPIFSYWEVRDEGRDFRVLSLWGEVWAEQLHGPITALPWGSCNQSDLQNEKCIAVCFGSVYLMMLSLTVCIYYGGVVPFLHNRSLL